jgi:predicted phage terminase large subunit-like protein
VTWIDDLEAELALQFGDNRASWPTPLDMAMALDPGYVARDHLKYLSDRLAKAVADVHAGQSRYILVSMPPRLGKSELCSVNFPTWLLHQHPDWPIMLLSHSPDLAAGWGRSIRRNVEDNGEILDVRIAKDAGAATDWETTEGGQILSRSIRQSITGRGARVMLLDDVVKDFADAHSLNNRNFVWDWWTANSRTRLEPPSLVVIIGTRWHEDDIIGRMRSKEWEGDPDQWEIISFPAIAEDHEDPNHRDILGRLAGEPLLSPIVNETPEEALVRWADIKQAVGTYAWSALFMQRPSPAEGAIFNNNWWRYWRPGDLDSIGFDRLITSWDCAFKDTDSSDWVVGQEWGVHGADRYLLRQVRGRWSFTETLRQMRLFINESGVYEHIVEDKANGTAVIDVLKTEIPGMIGVSPTTSKESRARAVTPEIESGNVFVPALADWLPDFLSEMKAFNNGTNDDQVDCLSQALNRLRSAGNVVSLVPQGSISRGYQRGQVGRSRRA